MKLEGLGRLRQHKGYSMQMVADLLRISLDAYAELEVRLREASSREKEILRLLLEVE